MIRKSLIGLMIASVSALAWAGIPDPDICEVWVGDYPGVANCGATFLPNGMGHTLENAFLRQNPPVQNDCRIWVQVKNAQGYPIPLHPADVWLEWGGNIALCPSEGPMDYALAMSQWTFPGLFYWEGTRATGGYGVSHKVFVLGMELAQRAEIVINSPDLNADGIVDTSDTAVFWDFYNTPGTFAQIDFNHDTLNNISDTAEYYGRLGAACP